VLLGSISTEDASMVSIFGDDLAVLVFDGFEVRHAEFVGERHAANRLGAVRHML
jgi:hypothetical protein